MNQPEINCDSSFPYNTYACAPPSANESVFFFKELFEEYGYNQERFIQEYD